MYKKNNEKYIDRNDLYFSYLRGSGVYCWNNKEDVDPTDISGQTKNPLFMNVNTDELFRVKDVYWKQNFDEYRYAILHAPETEHVIWPVDLVELNYNKDVKTFVEPDYSVHFTSDDSIDDTNMAFLFPNQSYNVSKTVENVLQEAVGKKAAAAISWKQERVLKTAVNITDAVSRINQKGYLCLDFDFSRMYLTDEKKILFEYSHLFVRDKEECGDAPDYVMDAGEYIMEFAMPAVVQGRIYKPDASVQNYSLAAMLFYLLIGRYAYDGPLIAGFPDTNEVEHMHKFEAYHNNPVFIFDPKDSSNHLGEFSADIKYIEAWKGLPDMVRDAFVRSLCEKSALAQGKYKTNIVTPEEWLELLSMIRQEAEN